MYQKHGIERLPEDLDSSIWRYMDFTKFVRTLDTQSLFFCRADCLDDRFEGTWGLASRQSIEHELKRRIQEGGNVIGGIQRQLSGHKQNAVQMRRTTAVNCWHWSPHESAAMWKLYVLADQGIAIRSTTSRLIQSLSDDKEMLVHVGLVNYIDFETEDIPFNNYLHPFLHKRRSFEHERELRALAYKAEITATDNSYSERVLNVEFEEPGENVRVDLSTLIDSVYLAPGSPRWMEQLLVSVAEHYDVNVTISRSELDKEPI